MSTGATLRHSLCCLQGKRGTWARGGASATAGPATSTRCWGAQTGCSAPPELRCGHFASAGIMCGERQPPLVLPGWAVSCTTGRPAYKGSWVVQFRGGDAADPQAATAGPHACGQLFGSSKPCHTCRIVFYSGQAATHVCRQFFRSGKSLPVDRGAGVNQAVVRTAADRVLRGDWLHLFPEGKVRSQQSTAPWRADHMATSLAQTVLHAACMMSRVCCICPQKGAVGSQQGVPRAHPLCLCQTRRPQRAAALAVVGSR